MANQEIEEHLQLGNIWHSDLFKETEIGHGKFFVVAGAIDDSVYGYFFINSHINFNVNRHMEQAELQLEIYNTDYPFLTKDKSFIGAANLEVFPKQKFLESVTEGKTKWKCMMKEEHIDILCDKINKSSLYSRRIKRLLFRFGEKK